MRPTVDLPVPIKPISAMLWTGRVLTMRCGITHSRGLGTQFLGLPRRRPLHFRMLPPSCREMRARFLSAMLLAVLLASCSTPERAKSRPASALPPPSQSCVRIANTSSNVVALQIAIRKFVPAHGKGAAVWLTGVSHIGDSNYYAALQKHLDAQRLVLFEGVSATPDGPARGAGSGPSGPAQPDRQDRPTLQAAMAKSLGLVFQLDAIDYRRPNFRGSDLSVAQLRKVFDEMPPSDAGSDASQGFENLLQLMQGGS